MLACCEAGWSLFSVEYPFVFVNNLVLYKKYTIDFTVAFLY